MRIGINASFLRKQNTGIGQVTVNFLRKLTEFSIFSAVADQFSNKFQSRVLGTKSKFQDLEFILYLEEDLPSDIKLPDNFTKRVFLPIYKRDDLIRKIWWEKYLLPRKAKEDKCDVFISLYQCPTVIARERSDRGNPVPINSGLLRFTRNDIKHIMVAHDIVPKLFPEYLNNFRKKLYWNLTEKALASADKIIAVSHRTEKDLIQHLGIAPEKITVNYIDVDEIYKKNVETRFNASILKKYKLKPGYIFAGGGLEVRKNMEGVIRAYKILYAKNKQEKFVKEFPKLVISGKLLAQLAPLVTDAEKLVKELNLTKQVKLLDFVPQADLPALYQNALVFVYPSHYEGFGLPVLEAMNQGVPTITAKTSSLPEVGGDSVLYCNPDDIEDIAMVMKNVMLNKDLRGELSRRGKERSKNFSWKKFAEKTLHIISNLQ